MDALLTGETCTGKVSDSGKGSDTRTPRDLSTRKERENNEKITTVMSC